MLENLRFSDLQGLTGTVEFACRRKSTLEIRVYPSKGEEPHTVKFGKEQLKRIKEIAFKITEDNGKMATVTIRPNSDGTFRFSNEGKIATEVAENTNGIFKASRKARIQSVSIHHKSADEMRHATNTPPAR